MNEVLTAAYQKLTEDGPAEVGRATSRYLNKAYYNRTCGRAYNKRGTNIHGEDWDNLVILDACRFDRFEALCDLDGRLEHRISRGSTSGEFIRGNFENHRAYDTVYLSDNPWYGRLHDELDSELYHFSFCPRDAFDGTVSKPSTVTAAAIDYDREYPDKRLIVHYMQPHAPYFHINGEERYRWPTDEWGCDPGELRVAYDDNLRMVLSEVAELLEALDGRTVITADHGELLGERLPPLPLRQFQHPGGIYVEELVKVPWFVVDDGERKDIVEADEPADWGYEEVREDVFEEQLEALGYI